MRITRLNSFDSLNESKVLDSIKSWLSRSLGGPIKKLDELIFDYKSKELGYVEEWEDTLTDIDALEITSQTAKDVAEDKSAKRMIERKKDLLARIKDKHKKETDLIFSKAKSIIGKDNKLEEYWGKEKAEADAEIAKKMYDIAKDLSNDDLKKTLYDKYKKAISNSEAAVKDYTKKFSKIKSEKSLGKERLAKIAGLPLSEFMDEIKELSEGEAKEVHKIATEKRNTLYADMDVQVEKLKRESSEASDKALIAKKIDKIKKRYMEEVREYRTKITLAKKYF
jgi:hypothetical protein